MTRLSRRWFSVVLAGTCLLAITPRPAIAQCEVHAFLEAGNGRHHTDGKRAAVVRPDWTVVDIVRIEGLQLVHEAEITFPELIFGVHIHNDWLVLSWHLINPLVRIYRRIDGVWTHVQTLPNPPSPGGFGQSLSMDGDRLLIGAPGWNNATGRAYVYRLDGDQWEFEAILDNPGLETMEATHFGWSVVLKSGRAVVGAHTTPSGPNTGRVYVFDHDGENWGHTQTLTPDPPDLPGTLGASVATSGEVIVAGAPTSTGHGRVYVWGPGPSDATWIQGSDLPIVLDNPFQSNVNFGNAVAVNEEGTHLIGGAADDSTAGFVAGAAFLLRRDDNGEWVFQKKLVGSNLGGNEAYGRVASMAGDYALIGAINANGKVHLYAGILGEDCNGSGQPDACDIFFGDSEDSNNNLIPDECEVPPGPPGDLNGDGVVDTFDLLILLGAWGECDDVSNCAADLNGDGIVNVFDLLILLANWS